LLRPEFLAALADDALGPRAELVARDGAKVLVRAQPHRDRIGSGLFVTHDEHVWYLLQLGVAHLGVHALFAHVHLDTQPGLAQAVGHRLSILAVALIRDWDDHGLHRREP